mmetsp:Transcript_49813/g.161084  ORF Transcript_49813/g.161084 Transcript_49813/m.161084 type:complete len:276 (-) Transcript_49813:846-1673(-)
MRRSSSGSEAVTKERRTSAWAERAAASTAPPQENCVRRSPAASAARSSASAGAAGGGVAVRCDASRSRVRATSISFSETPACIEAAPPPHAVRSAARHASRPNPSACSSSTAEARPGSDRLAASPPAPPAAACAASPSTTPLSTSTSGMGGKAALPTAEEARSRAGCSLWIRPKMRRSLAACTCRHECSSRTDSASRRASMTCRSVAREAARRVRCACQPMTRDAYSRWRKTRACESTRAQTRRYLKAAPDESALAACSLTRPKLAIQSAQRGAS